MKFFNLNIKHLCFAASLIWGCVGFAQSSGSLEINQNPMLTKLLQLKKDNGLFDWASAYKIQIYSGNRGGAEAAQSKFNGYFSYWRTSLQYESPNFKIWAGSFSNRLDADRALREVKTKFANAFIFKPKK